jgi:hypothetical protein
VRRTLQRMLIAAWLMSGAAACTTAASSVDPPASPAGGVPFWTQVRGFFTGLLAPDVNGTDGVCAFDNVVAGQVEPGARDIVIPVKKKAWEQALGGEDAAKPYIAARLAGWPSRLLADKGTLPSTDDAFIARLARDVWSGLDALADRENSLPVDHVHFGRTSVAPADASVGDYTSITSVGLRMVAIVAAFHLEFISQRAAIDRLRALLTTLSQLETYDGFFFNYYDTTSLERTSNFVSFVDSSWLTAGLMVVRMTFPELAAQCTQLIERTDYRFFYDDQLQLMSHGYYVQRAARSKYHYGVLYAESRLGSLIAIGKGDVPDAHWFKMVRTFPRACAWQTQAPRARRRKQVEGYPVIGGYYEWQALKYVPSWGGSMFEALMPTMVLDERQHAPRSLGANDVAHAVVQRRYAIEDLAYPVWGLSSSTTPSGNGYAEYGVKVLGSVGYPAGPVTPHAAALTLSVTPQAGVADLRRLAELYDIYGDYGFYDAVDPHSGEVAHTYLALDQSMMFIALANYLDDHCIQKRFASDPIVQTVLPVIGVEDFFD